MSADCAEDRGAQIHERIFLLDFISPKGPASTPGWFSSEGFGPLRFLQIYDLTGTSCFLRAECSPVARGHS
jgi:hypothetical protein